MRLDLSKWIVFMPVKKKQPYKTKVSLNKSNTKKNKRTKGVAETSKGVSLKHLFDKFMKIRFSRTEGNRITVSSNLFRFLSCQRRLAYSSQGFQ